MSVVPGPFLGIGEDFVRRLDFGEFRSGIFDIAEVSVGMKFEGFPSVCFLDSVKCQDLRSIKGEGYSSLFVSRMAINTEHFVVAFLRWLNILGSCPCARRLLCPHGN